MLFISVMILIVLMDQSAMDGRIGAIFNPTNPLHNYLVNTLSLKAVVYTVPVQ